MEDEEEESRGDVAMDEVFIPPLLPLPSFFSFIFFFFPVSDYNFFLF